MLSGVQGMFIWILDFMNEIESNPVIAAVKDMDGLHKAVKIDSIRITSILFGFDVCNIVLIL